MKVFFFSLFFLSRIFYVGAQANATWYFGNNAGITFTTNPPSLLSNGMVINPDNVSTVSDATGNLLFYSDGSTVWNKNHQIMSNGSGLMGNFTSGQCALIVPIPCSASRYLVFSPTEFASPGYLHYSMVDLSLSNGLGMVDQTTKNTSLGSGWTEKLCAYYYAPGNYYWVLAHKWNSADFVAFKITASGISTQSVVSTVGAVHFCGQYSAAHDAMGQLTISPDGKKVANAVTCQDFFEVLDFNPATGVVSNPIVIAGQASNAWGTAFSPDSKKLYTNSIFGSNIYQYDLSIFSANAIQASGLPIGSSNAAGYSFGYMELAVDNRIYIARPNSSFLAAILLPNSSGISCTFNLNALSLGTQSSSWGLSRCAYNISSSVIPLSYSINPAVICVGQNFTISINGSQSNSWNNVLGGSQKTYAVSTPTTIIVTELEGCRSASITIMPQKCQTTLSELSFFTGKSFYPNPCKDFLLLDFSPVSDIVICDLSGRKILTLTPYDYSIQKGIDVSTLQNGLYILNSGYNRGYFVKE